MQSRISVNASWKHQCPLQFSKLEMHFPSSPARKASGSSPCPAKPCASAGLQRGSQPSAALRPSESPLHNQDSDLPSTAVRNLGRNSKYCFPLPKHFHFHLLTCWRLVCFYCRVSAPQLRLVRKTTAGGFFMLQTWPGNC